MSAELLQLLNGVQTMSIVGMCKNAGKTTMLNWMLHHDRLQGTLGLTSIGRDGESTDVVTGTEKPGIFVREGTLIATARICCGWGHHAGDHGDHRHPHAAGGGGDLPGPQRRQCPAGRALHHHAAQGGLPAVLRDGGRQVHHRRRSGPQVSGRTGRGGGGHPLHRGLIPHEHRQGRGRHRPRVPVDESAQGGRPCPRRWRRVWRSA